MTDVHLSPGEAKGAGSAPAGGRGFARIRRRPSRPRAFLRAAGRLVAVALSCLVLHHGTGAAGQSRRVPVDHAMVEQKAVFLSNLVNRSVAARTIESRGDASAKSKLEEARRLVAEARDDLAAGRTEAANDKLDEALGLVNKETRKLSQASVEARRTEDQYRKRLDAVKTFLAAYGRVSESKGAAASDIETDAFRKEIAKSEALAEDGKIQEAKAILDKIYATVTANIRTIHDGDTVVRSLDFKTAEEEYAYELNRSDSYVALLTLALDRKTPHPTIAKRIEKLRRHAIELRAEAERKAAGGAHPEAIDLLIESTNTLVKAIRMGGVFIPG